MNLESFNFRSPDDEAGRKTPVIVYILRIILMVGLFERKGLQILDVHYFHSLLVFEMVCF